MNKILLSTGGGVAAALVFCTALYTGSYIALKKKFETELSTANIEGFKLYLDGVVIDNISTDNLRLTRIYINANPWRLYKDKAEYINILKATVKTDTLFSSTIAWPLAVDIPLVIEQVNFNLNFMGEDLAVAGTAKQDPGTPLLVDFHIDSEQLPLQGQAEVRIHNHQAQMLDLEFEDAAINVPELQAKRMSGWLSYSYEQGWQVIGELEAGFTGLTDYSFANATVKVNGTALSPDITFSGNNNGEVTEINRKDNAISLQKDERVFPVSGQQLDNTLLQNITVTLNKLEQLRLAELQQEEEKKTAKEKTKKSVRAKEIEIASTEPVIEAAEPVTPQPVPVAKIEPVKLPEIRLEKLLENSDLKGFVYTETLVPVKQLCSNGSNECWTAHATGGQITYDVRTIPEYFIKLKDYEQSKVLQEALLGFKVQSLTVDGIGTAAKEMTVKGTTARGQPAELQLSVLAGE